MKKIPAGDPVRSSKASETASSETERKSAWLTYLQHEPKLLEEHYGEYAWVVPGKVRAVCRTREDLCKVLVEQKSGGRGIIVKINKEEGPTIPIASPEFELGMG